MRTGGRGPTFNPATVIAEAPKPTPAERIQTFETALATMFGDVLVSVRVVMKNGEPWFVAKDVTKALGYTNGRDAVAKHVDDDQKDGVAIRDAIGRNQTLTTISEGGLYALITGSKLAHARLFKRWVFDTVLPSIRKNGGYILGQEKVATGEMSDAELMARARW